MKLVQLFEAFDTQSNFKITKNTQHQFTTYEEIGNRTIDFEAEYQGGGNWNIVFTEESENGKSTFDKTGSGNEMHVCAMVLASMKKLIELKNPKFILFHSSKSDGNRTKLYKRLCDRYITKLGYEISLDDSDKIDDLFILVKKN